MFRDSILTMNKIIKLLGTLTLGFGILLMTFFYRDVAPFWGGTSTERLASLWRRDIAKLMSNEKLPQAWFNVKTVRHIPMGQTPEKWLKEGVSPLKPTGGTKNFELEVLIDAITDNDELGAMIQYTLIDTLSGNTIWQIGRTLMLGKVHDKKEDS